MNLTDIRRNTALIQYSLSALAPIAQHGDLVQFHITGLPNIFSILSFTRTTAGWHMHFGKSDTILPRFLVALGASILEEYHSNYHTVFTGMFVTMYEHVPDDTPRPIRIGLDTEEQQILLRHARNAIRAYFSEKSEDVPIPERLEEPGTVCVAVWVGGKLRGSKIVARSSISDAVAAATIDAIARDHRFKPLSLTELEDATLEITIFSDIRIRMLKEEMAYLHYEKGCTVTDGQSTGWYLPEVFNAVSFQSPYEFYRSLAEQKAHIKHTRSRALQYFLFEVIDFVESTDARKPVSMSGPVPIPTLIPETDVPATVRSSAQIASLWLEELQEEDGNIPPIINPFTGGQTQVDWARLAFSAQSLITFGNTTHNHSSLECGENALRYVKPHAEMWLRSGTSERYFLAFVYLGHAYIAQKNIKEALQHAEYVRNVIQTIPTENLGAIPLLQSISLFEKLSRVETTPQELYDLKRSLEQHAIQRFSEQKVRPNTDVASWAEAVYAFRDSNPEFVTEVVAWILSHQNKDGSFKQSHASNFTYTRGTSKIFEVLAPYYEQYEEEIRTTLSWLMAMQYTESMMYFVPKGIRPQVRGGFRHDYGNASLWIDSAGHFLLGAARLMEHQALVSPRSRDASSVSTPRH